MNSLWWKLYDRGLLLLPLEFRARYAQQMAVTAREASSGGPERLLHPVTLFVDLGQSALRENTRMLLKQISRRPFLYQAIWLSVVAFFIALGGYVLMQQTIRRAANHPQREMALDAAAALERGADPAAIAANRGIDFAHSLEPFIIVYDEHGHVVASQASFATTVPAPPFGVFLSARRRDRNELTWQPGRDIRLATTTIHFAGPHPGYVLAARSLWTAESGEVIARYAALFGWLGIVALLMISGVVFDRLQGPRQHA